MRKRDHALIRTRLCRVKTLEDAFRMMTNALSLRRLLGVIFIFGAGVSPAMADITSGIWLRGDGAAKVRMQRCGESLCAVNVWIKTPGDEKVGDRLVLDVKPRGPGLLEGAAFDPQRNLRFSSRITYSDSKMTTSGCMLAGLLCRSVEWTKVSSR